MVAAQAALLAPIQGFRRAYLPPLLIYLSAGALGLTAVADQFWVKEALTLSPAELAGLAVWLGLPAVMKMVFGELVDTVTLAGSRRRVYLAIGAGLMATGFLLLATAAAGRLTWAAPDRLYVAASLCVAIGYVLQDVVADAMTTEVVARTDADGVARAQAEIDADLAMVQVLGRLFIAGGSLAVAYLAGWLATVLPYWQVFALGLVIPLLSLLAILLTRLDGHALDPARPTDWRILGGGIAFGLSVLGIGLLGLPFAQELTFLVSVSVIGIMLARVSADLDPMLRKRIFYAALIIFAFRCFPTVGDGYRWFLIDRYGFDELFFGGLNTIGTLLTLVTGWLLAGVLTRASIPTALMWLTVVTTLMALPSVVLVFEGAMAWTTATTGLGPRSLAVIDSAAQSPILNLAMIPMLTLIAVNAPPQARAVWFALMASFMNVALTGGDLMTKALNLLFPVARGSYDHLPALTLWVLVVTTVIPVTAILAWRKHLR
jgi:hypothetical protein